MPSQVRSFSSFAAFGPVLDGSPTSWPDGRGRLAAAISRDLAGAVEALDVADRRGGAPRGSQGLSRALVAPRHQPPAQAGLSQFGLAALRDTAAVPTRAWRLLWIGVTGDSRLPLFRYALGSCMTAPAGRCRCSSPRSRSIRAP